MADPGVAELPPYYYRDNFLHLCDTVEAQYADLLAAPEQRLLQRFRSLEFKAQCLYVRLVSRVGPWFRESKLGYAELGEPGPLLDALLESGLVMPATVLSVQELGKLYTRDELQRAFESALAQFTPTDKPSLLAAIEGLELDTATALQLLGAVDTGRVIAPRGVEQVQLLQLLFFGNRRQSLTEFVLSDLGVARYYPYPLDRAHRLFTHRRALDEYLACAALSDTWYELRDAADLDGLCALASEILATEIAYPASEQRWYRLCNGLARELERNAQPSCALALYSLSQRHPARERRARLLERTGEWAAASVLCQDMLAAPWCEEEQEAAARILPRLQRKLGETPAPRRRDQFSQVKLVLAPGEGSVEMQAAAHLAPAWRQVSYVENALMNTLFGLAFWEQIFAPVPGAFHNPYQRVPADMYEAGFYARREASLTARLAQLRGGNLPGELRQAYGKYHLLQCRWVDWRRIDADLLQRVTYIVPAAHLLAVWERMLFDPRENRRGFPDLIALGDTPGDYRLIEIKGPGDALQDSQRRWLRFFVAHGIPAEIAWVEWCDN